MKNNDKYSFGDFTGQAFRDQPAEEFNGTEIVGSCFSQENEPDSHVFPDDMKGVTFRRCNLDNVYIPPGNTVVTEGWEACCTRRLMYRPLTPGVKPDVKSRPASWIVDADNNPVEPLDKRRFEEEGRSLEPADIPEYYPTEVG